MNDVNLVDSDQNIDNLLINFYTPYKYIVVQVGKIRRIYVPPQDLKRSLKKLLPLLKAIHSKYQLIDCDHAFYKVRNCITHAKSHIEQRYVLCVDIQDFFSAISLQHLRPYIPANILKITLIDGILPQGFPTSPYLANIAMIPVDYQLTRILKQLDPAIIYTRYADDMAFSFSDIKNKDKIIKHVVELLTIYDFKINTHKTKLWDKQKGRAIITGVAVSFTGIHPTRKTLKKIRAAAHQNNQASIKGLTEWSLCKPPNIIRK